MRGKIITRTTWPPCRAASVARPAEWNREKIFDSWTFTCTHSGPSTEKRSSPATPPPISFVSTGRAPKDHHDCFRARRKSLACTASSIVLRNCRRFQRTRTVSWDVYEWMRICWRSCDRYRFARLRAIRKSLRPNNSISPHHASSSRAIFKYPCNPPWSADPLLSFSQAFNIPDRYPECLENEGVICRLRHAVGSEERSGTWRKKVMTYAGDDLCHWLSNARRIQWRGEISRGGYSRE